MMRAQRSMSDDLFSFLETQILCIRTIKYCPNTDGGKGLAKRKICIYFVPVLVPILYNAYLRGLTLCTSSLWRHTL